MADGPLHSGRCSLECLGDLRVQYLGDGVGGLAARQRASKSGRITLQIQRLNVGDLLLSLSSRLLLLYGFENMIAKPNSKVKREPNEHFRKFLAVFSVFFYT